jgi:DUF4097 and DUF4098 domain-containing protein YvlB
MNVNVCLRAAFGVVLAALLSTACDVSIKDGNVSLDLVTGKAVDDSTRTYPIAPDGVIEIENRNGSIEVSAAEVSQVEVTISRQAEARSDEAAQTLLKQVEIVEERESTRVRLETKAPRDRSTRVNYTVRAPRSLSTVLKTENGRVLVTGMSGQVRASGSNGPIDGKQLAGAVEANTINGPVRMDLASVGGDINLATVNGPVRLIIPPTVKADFSARSLNGRIMSFGLTFENLDQKSGREMEGRLNGGGPRVRLETTNGPIFITSGSEDVEKLHATGF